MLERMKDEEIRMNCMSKRMKDEERRMNCMLRSDEGLRKSPFQQMDFPGEKSISRNAFQKCIFHRKSPFQKMDFQREKSIPRNAFPREITIPRNAFSRRNVHSKKWIFQRMHFLRKAPV